MVEAHCTIFLFDDCNGVRLKTLGRSQLESLVSSVYALYDIDLLALNFLYTHFSNGVLACYQVQE